MNQQIRNFILKRDHNTCQNCFIISANLDIHHILPQSKGGLDSPNNLISLCRSCHMMLEPRKTLIPKNKILIELDDKTVEKVEKKAESEQRSRKQMLELIIERAVN